VKFVVDMNLSPKWVARLSTSGHDAVHWSAIGVPGASDQDIASWALAERCIVLTADLDFGALLAASRADGPSVVQLRSAVLRPSIIGDSVVHAIAAASLELLKGAFMTYDGKRARLKNASV
jgi:predicted nuclease of predicted toxin-antitoxin system